MAAAEEYADRRVGDLCAQASHWPFVRCTSDDADRSFSRERYMNTLRRSIGAAILMALAGGTMNTAIADDSVALATGGYATSLRTMEMMHMIDANKDGKVSKDEWVAYQTRLFMALDKNGDGFLDVEEFYGNPKAVDFATGGYARALETKQMFGKIDANGDG